MQKITISHPSDAWQRLDRFCKKYLSQAALWGIYKMLRTGKIKVNGKKKDQTYKIDLGDEITFWISDEELNMLHIAPQSVWDSLREPKKSDNPLRILYEDEYLLVVDKPAHINVHSGDHKTTESNIIDQVQDYLQGRHDSLTFRPALVHRIDRDTSGCLLVAKDKETLAYLLFELQSHSIEKIYHAIVLGKPSEKSWTIRAKLLRIENAQNEAKVRVDEAWQWAITHYRCMQSWDIHEDTPWYSLLECRIETGRTHQIRVHMAHIGCPILADKAYGQKKENSYFSRHKSIDRQMLHARALSFIHPVTKKRLSIEAPYPTDFLWLMTD